MGFEPTRAEPNGLAVHRLNHSATSSHDSQWQVEKTFSTFLVFNNPNLYVYSINEEFRRKSQNLKSSNCDGLKSPN